MPRRIYSHRGLMNRMVEKRAEGGPFQPVGLMACGLICMAFVCWIAIQTIQTTPIEGLKAMLAASVPFLLLGLAFDLLQSRIPIISFTRRCICFWIPSFPASRLLCDALIGLSIGTIEEMYEYLLYTYPSAWVIIIFTLAMAVMGVGYGYIFSRVYALIFTYLTTRRLRGQEGSH